jgi:hypothetical protein
VVNRPILINFLLFQAGWFVCVLGGAWQWPWVGVAYVALATAWHLTQVPNPRGESLLLLAAAAVGVLLDSLLPAAGWVTYPSGQLHAALAPVWIVALWVLFAGTLNMSMKWLKHRYLLAAVFGGIGSPMSFYAGSRLGAVTLVDPVMALGAQAVLWALALPALLWLAARCERLAEPVPRAAGVSPGRSG